MLSMVLSKDAPVSQIS